MTSSDSYHWPSILVGVLIVVVLANAFEFFPIDQRARPNYRALMRYDTPDLLAIGVRDSSTIAQRFGLAHALAEVAPGSRLIVPSAGRFQPKAFSAELFAFGGVEEVAEREYDARELGRGLDLKSFYIASGKGGARGAP